MNATPRNNYHNIYAKGFQRRDIMVVFFYKENRVCMHFKCRDLIRHKTIKGRCVRNYV
jgi:hypothetical protein